MNYRRGVERLSLVLCVLWACLVLSERRIYYLRDVYPALWPLGLHVVVFYAAPWIYRGFRPYRTSAMDEKQKPEKSFRCIHHPDGMIETIEIDDPRPLKAEKPKPSAAYLLSDAREMAEAGMIEQVGLTFGPKPKDSGSTKPTTLPDPKRDL